jgi:hypothetical protein
VLEGKRKKPRLPALLDALARAKPIAVPLHELHADPVPLLEIFARTASEKADFAEVFAGAPDSFVLQLRTQVEGTAMVTTFGVDLGAWFGMFQRANAQAKAKAQPKDQPKSSG